jgi:Cdc6-like AAA superfamily ATPase
MQPRKLNLPLTEAEILGLYVEKNSIHMKLILYACLFVIQGTVNREVSGIVKVYGDLCRIMNLPPLTEKDVTNNISRLNRYGILIFTEYRKRHFLIEISYVGIVHKVLREDTRFNQLRKVDYRCK